MIKYAKIVNEITGQCEIAYGSDIGYFLSQGFQGFDVEQSYIDSLWYLAEKCPKKPKEQKFKEAKDAKYQEANTGARAYLESGEALFELTPTQHIEATDGNIGKLGAYAMSFLTGLIKPDDVVYWNTKEDETIALTQEQLSTVLMGLGAVQAQVWNERFPAYKAQIEACETVEEVEAIEIDYSAQPPEESTENKESEKV